MTQPPIIRKEAREATGDGKPLPAAFSVGRWNGQYCGLGAVLKNGGVAHQGSAE